MSERLGAAADHGDGERAVSAQQVATHGGDRDGRGAQGGQGGAVEYGAQSQGGCVEEEVAGLDPGQSRGRVVGCHGGHLDPHVVDARCTEPVTGAGRHQQQVAMFDGHGDAGDVARRVEAVVQRLLDTSASVEQRRAQVDSLISTLRERPERTSPR